MLLKLEMFFNLKSTYVHNSSEGFPNFGTIDIGVQIILCDGAVLYIV